MYIEHLTITTGHCRRSPREEVSDAALSAMLPWLKASIQAGGIVALLAPMSDYGARCLTQDGALVVTVYAPQPQVGQRPPLVTFGVAHRSRQGAALWTELLKVGPAAPGTREPRAPWCGVHVHPSIVGYMDALSWLGDFERCVAWAWISKHDPRGF